MAITPSPAKKSFFNPGNVLLILGLLFGSLYCVFIPYGAGFDEEQHVVRIFDIAGGNLLPNRSSEVGTPTYADFIQLSYQRRYYQTPADDLFLAGKFFKPLDKGTTVGFPTRSIYPPASFAPQAPLARFFWRKYAYPVIPVAILLRWVGLLVYIGGCYLTVRLLPVGKWVFMVLALAPMALFQAATLNADGFTNAAAFVFIGLTLNIYAGSEEHVPPLKVWGLAAVIVLLGLAKPGTVFILPLILLLPWRRIQPRGLWAALGAAVLLAFLITAGYNGLGVQGSHFSEGGGQSLGRQLSLILANPLDFGMTFIKGNLLAAVRYFKDWTGVYGYWNGTVPQVVYWLFPLALLGSLLAEPKAQWLKVKVRLVMAGVFLAASAATALMFFTVHYTPGDLSSFGRQGRYFIFTAPLLYLSLAGLVSVGAAWIRRVQVAAVSLLTLTLVCYSFGIYATYYTWCGSTLYTFKSCSQPIYKNLDIGNTPSAGVNSATSLSQGFTSVCGDVTAVDVYLKVKPEGDQGELRFSLVDGSGQVVASQEFPLASLKASKYLRLAVPPSASQHGPGYTIRLEAPDLQPPTTLQVATSAENQYREGDFWVGEKKSSDDLIFRYMCASAWKKHQ